MSLDKPRNVFITPDDGIMYIKMGENILAVTMTGKDLNMLEKYIEKIKRKVVLKNNPTTEEEREFKRAYHYLYNKERSIKQKYKAST